MIFVLVVFELAIVVLLIRYLHLKHLHLVNQFRGQLATELQRNLDDRLREIKAMLDQQNNPNLAQGRLKSLATNLKALTESSILASHSLLWSLNPSNSTLNDLVVKLMDFCVANMLFRAPLQVNACLSDQSLKETMNPMNANLLLVTVQEILLSMEQHTESEQIKIEIQLKKRQLEIGIYNAFALVPPTKLPPLPGDPTLQEMLEIDNRTKRFKVFGGYFLYAEDLEGQSCRMCIPIR
jgi:signal transduction histidine kinase